MKPILAQANSIHIPLPSESVHCIITSVPYYMQRRYKCPCVWPAISFRPSPHLETVWRVEPWFGELGWEPHPLDFVGHLVLVYREVFRVLRKEGQNWLNVGDKRTKDRQWYSVPEMLLAALMADGWRHEDTIIWHKPSAMPSSQINRFTRDFEKVYLLNKSRRAYLDLDAVREPLSKDVKSELELFGERCNRLRDIGGRQDGFTGPRGTVGNLNGRTRRTVWSIFPKGTNLDHYAAFPVDLVTPMLKCSISERGCCPICKAPWVRVTDKVSHFTERPGHPTRYGNTPTMSAKGYSMPSIPPPDMTTTGWIPSCTCYGSPSRGPVTCGKCKGKGKELEYSRGREAYRQATPNRTISGLQRDHDGGDFAPPQETGNPCPACKGTGTVIGDVWPDDVDTWEVAPSIVLDPFAGTGTVGEALAGLQNQHTEAGTVRYPGVFIGLDLKHKYLADLARDRLQIKALEQWEQGKDGGDWIAAVSELAERQSDNGRERQMTLVESA